VAIKFGLRVLLAIDFNGVGFMCVFYWVHEGWRLPAEDALLSTPSVI
jgi:hypothetical protein